MTKTTGTVYGQVAPVRKGHLKNDLWVVSSILLVSHHGAVGCTHFSKGKRSELQLSCSWNHFALPKASESSQSHASSSPHRSSLSCPNSPRPPCSPRNGSLVQLEKEPLEEEIDPKLIVGSYKLSNGSGLLVIAEVHEGSDQFRYTCLFSETHILC